MQFSTFISSEEDLLAASKAKFLKEVLIEPALLAREGRLTRDKVEALSATAKRLNFDAVLVWDILMTDRDFQICTEEIKAYNLDNYCAVRVQCPGAAHWLKENYPNIKIHYIAETGNNNLPSLQAWVDNLGINLVRLILNIQLPEEKLCEYIKKLPVDCELLGSGRILLFYSRRKLLQPNFTEIAKEQDSPWIEVLADSPDSQNRKFPILENLHGTFMYLDRDQFILDRLKNLESSGIHTIRIDLRHLSQAGNSADKIDHICQSIADGDDKLRANWPNRVIAPFFKSNLTTKQFSKLKSKLKLERDSDCFAELVSCESGKLVAFYTLREFEANTPMVLINPRNESIDCGELHFRDMSGNQLKTCKAHQLVTTFWIKGAMSGALLKNREPC